MATQKQIATVMMALLVGVGCERQTAANSPQPAPRASAMQPPADVQAKLAAPSAVGGLNLTPLDSALRIVLGRAQISYRIDREAFLRAGIDPDKRMVAHSGAHGAPVAKLLQEILDQVPARYSIDTVDGQTLNILPKP